MNRIRYLVFGLFLLGGCSLADVKVNVVGERTSLENQVLGSYNALTGEALLASSVRGVDPLGRIRYPPPQSGDKKQAVEALRTLSFHADDVDAFKSLGRLGEDMNGLLTTFAEGFDDSPADVREYADRFSEEELQSIVDEVNEARDTVMRRVVETDPSLSEDNLPEVRRVFARLNAAAALPGERIQAEDGEWTRKE